MKKNKLIARLAQEIIDLKDASNIVYEADAEQIAHQQQEINRLRALLQPLELAEELRMERNHNPLTSKTEDDQLIIEGRVNSVNVQFIANETEWSFAYRPKYQDWRVLAQGNCPDFNKQACMDMAWTLAEIYTDPKTRGKMQEFKSNIKFAEEVTVDLGD